MAAELLFADQGLEVLRVPYKSNNDAIKDLLGGQIDFAFSTVGPIQGYLQTGRLRALALTDPKRSDLLAGVPTMSETIPGFSVTGWYGLVGPKDLPADVVNALSSAVQKVLNDSALRSKLGQLGSQASSSSPQEFGAFIAAEIPRWQTVVKKAKLQ